MWKTKIKRKMEKKLAAMPRNVQVLVAELKKDLECRGPVQGGWENYSKLYTVGGGHHCHLTLHYVACWKEIDKENIEIYYIGQREGAPY